MREKCNKCGKYDNVCVKCDIRFGKCDIRCGKCCNGCANVTPGVENVTSGSENVTIGVENVKIGLENVATGAENVTTGAENFKSPKTALSPNTKSSVETPPDAKSTADHDHDASNFMDLTFDTGDKLTAVTHQDLNHSDNRESTTADISITLKTTVVLADHENDIPTAEKSADFFVRSSEQKDSFDTEHELKTTKDSETTKNPGQCDMNCDHRSSNQSETGQEDRELSFLQSELYTGIIEKLTARNAEKWVKECGITQSSSCCGNQKILLKVIDLAIAGKTKLPATLINKLVQKLNDSAITTELYNWGITSKKTAKSRKNQLLDHLIQKFSDIEIRQEKLSMTSLKPSASKLNKSLKQQKKGSRKSIKSEKVSIENEVTKRGCNKNLSNLGYDKTTITPERDPHAQRENRSEHSPSDAEMKLKVQKIVKNDYKELSKTEKAQGKPGTSEKCSNPTKTANKSLVCEDLEIPLKTLEAKALDLSETVARHEQILLYLSKNEENKSDIPQCGLTKIEVSELQDQLLKMEKDNATLLKTINAQQEALNRIPEINETMSIMKNKMEKAIDLQQYWEIKFTECDASLEEVKRDYQTFKTEIYSKLHCFDNRLYDVKPTHEAEPSSIQEDGEVKDDKASSSKKRKKKKRQKETEGENQFLLLPPGNITRSTKPNHKAKLRDIDDTSITRNVDPIPLRDEINATVGFKNTNTSHVDFKPTRLAKIVTKIVERQHDSSSTDETNVLPGIVRTVPLSNQNLPTKSCQSGTISSPRRNGLESKTKSVMIQTEDNNTTQTMGTLLPHERPPRTYSTVISTEQQNNRPSPEQSNNEQTYYRDSSHKRKCLMINDYFHENFDPTRFTKKFEVEQIKIKHIHDVTKEPNNMTDKILSSDFEVLYIHVGYEDVWSGSKVEEVTESFKKLIQTALEHTNTKICLSLVIPGDKRYPKINKGVDFLNKCLSSFITDLRKNEQYKNRVFTENNDRLQTHIVRTVGPHGVKMKLSDRGEKLLWLNLKKGIERTLGVRLSQPFAPGGRETYRRYPPSNNRSNDR